MYTTGGMLHLGTAVEVLAEPDDPGFVLHEFPLLRLRALLARAHRDETGYRKYAKDYAALPHSLGFQAHMARASTTS